MIKKTLVVISFAKLGDWKFSIFAKSFLVCPKHLVINFWLRNWVIQFFWSLFEIVFWSLFRKISIIAQIFKLFNQKWFNVHYWFGNWKFQSLFKKLKSSNWMIEFSMIKLKFWKRLVIVWKTLIMIQSPPLIKRSKKFNCCWKEISLEARKVLSP